MDTKFIESLGRREGKKPETRGPVPHQQIDQYPESNQFAVELHDVFLGFDKVENGRSHIGDGGLSAFFLTTMNNLGWNPHFLIDNEFAHIHAQARHRSVGSGRHNDEVETPVRK
jgi:hypothetical protein